MSYLVLSENAPEKLEKEVEIWMKKGWTLQGGVAVAMDQGNCIFAQAMIKE